MRDGRLHGVAIGVPSLTVAAIFLTLVLRRGGADIAHLRRRGGMESGHGATAQHHEDRQDAELRGEPAL